MLVFASTTLYSLDILKYNELTQFKLGHNCIETCVSIGVSFYNGCNNDMDTLLSQADQAMYKAKKLGKGNYKVFEFNNVNSV